MLDKKLRFGEKMDLLKLAITRRRRMRGSVVGKKEQTWEREEKTRNFGPPTLQLPSLSQKTPILAKFSQTKLGSLRHLPFNLNREKL